MRFFIKDAGFLTPAGNSLSDLKNNISNGKTNIVETESEFNDKYCYYRIMDYNYKEYISAIKARRLSDILRAGIICSKKILNKFIEIKEQEVKDNKENKGLGLIIGTGLGTLSDTENFLEKIYQNGEVAASPTHFMNSVHNAIASQIALFFGLKGLNLTISAGNLSFESALLTAIIQLELRRAKYILCGGIDLHRDIVQHIYKKLGIDDSNSSLKSYSGSDSFMHGEGSVMFLLSMDDIEPRNYLAEILDIKELSERSIVTDNNIYTEFKADLYIGSSRGLSAEDRKEIKLLQSLFRIESLISYRDFCGAYSTSGAFNLLSAIVMNPGKIITIHSAINNSHFLIKLQVKN